MFKFNVELDKISSAELTDDLLDKINNAGQAALTKLAAHASDKTIHVTTTEKETWNSKAPNTSPNFTGTPTAPTADQSTNNDQIATTRYVNTKVNNYTPEVAETAKKLVSTNTFAIKGAITSSVQNFDGSNNVVMVVDDVPTKSLSGTISPDQLAGTYNISVTGNAATATNATTVGGYQASALAKVDSPTFTGKPKAPTAESGDSSTQIANTIFVSNAIANINFPDTVESADKLTNAVSVKVSGKATSNEVSFDGSNNIDLKITSLDVSDQLASYMPTKVNNHTVDSDVPINAVFTDTVYVHPNTTKDLTGQSYTQVVVDKQGHVVHGENPKNLQVSITGNADTANRLKDSFKVTVSGDAITTAAEAQTDGQNDITLDVDAINASAIVTDSLHRLVTDDEKKFYADKYTKAEIDGKLDRFKVDSGFDVIGSVDTVNDIATSFPNPVNGSVVFVKHEGLLYRFNGASWKCVAEYTDVTTEKHGLMTAVDKVKLDGIEEGANNYTLPEKLPASMITEDETHKFITTVEKTKLDDLYTKDQIDKQITNATPEATVDKAGLLSAADKIKLDGIETGANKYVLPKTLPASIITEDEEHRFTTDTEKASYADKYTKVEVNTLISNASQLATHEINGWMRSSDKVKLDGIEEGANNYKLPDTLPASMITEDETHQFVTSTDKTVYADKFTKAETRDAITKATPIVTTGTAGLMTAADKAKLDGIAANANKYVLPSTLPASMITEDVNHRFVTDQDKSDYADKYTKVEVEGLINAAKPEIVTKEAAGLMSASDKAKLDGIEASANKYVLPKTLPATMITEDKDHNFVTDLEKTTYLDKYTKTETTDLIEAAKPSVATQEANGLMSSTDKTKLDGIAEGANNYVLPDTLPATMIVPDDKHQFVSLTEKTYYADKYTKAETKDAIAKATPIVTTGTAGLMSAADKAKLDGIEANANNYVLPKTLPASMITEDVAHRFVTDQDKLDYSDKYTKVEVEGLINAAKPEVATEDAAGLMSASDKAKLNGIAANANKYVLPKTLPASMITEDAIHRFVTDQDKLDYSDKYTKTETTDLIEAAKPSVATQSANGLMSSTDKTKLDGIAEGANNYVLPETLPASMIVPDDQHQFVNLTEKASYADKYTKAETQNLITTSIQNANTDGMIWQKDVNSFSDIATTYPDPKKGWTVSVNDTGKIYRYNGTEWVSLSGSNATYQLATQTEDGLMASTDKVKLDGIEAGANNYVLPKTLPANMIATTDDKQFISSVEKTSYADKYTKSEVTNLIKEAKPGNATTAASGLMSAADKAKLDGIAANANNYTLPKTLPASMISTSDDLQFISLAEKGSYADKYTKSETVNLINQHVPDVVTTTANGLMIADDKVKLDGIEANANHYVLPETLPASMITEDETHKFITSDEKTKIANIYTKDEITTIVSEATPAATDDIAGLMSASDKAKLDGIEAGANNYTLPKTLPASMITTTDDKQFISATEKASYADKYTKSEVTNLIKEAKPNTVTTTTAGLMSAADKAKLDGIAAGANNYVLPKTLPASMISTSDDLQFVSLAEKGSYADKYTKSETENLINQHVPDVVTTKTNGLMIAADKVKLDGIEAGANHYVLPETLPASMITEDETHKFITTDEKTKIANVYTKDEITTIVSNATPAATDSKAGLMSAADKAKLDGIAANANNYTLPATLPASMITTTTDKQFISNTEKTSYADKYTKAEVDQKLTDIASGNINLSTYTRYKGNISAAQLTGSEEYSGKIEKDDLFFQDNGLIVITKASDGTMTTPEYQRLSTLSLVNSSTAGLMSAADKAKLDGIAANANKYVLPSSLPASMIIEDSSHKFVTSAEKTKLDGITTVTTTTEGLMSAADKVKLDGIEAGANKYVLPKTLPASMITEDNTHKFVTSAEKTLLSNVYTKAEVDAAVSTAHESEATAGTSGLMSAADKVKLDSIESGANKYVLPSTLPASMIATTSSLQFISSAEKAKIGTSYTKAESDAKYLTKVDATTDEINIGTGWKLEPDNSGNLIASYNGVTKFTVSTDGKIMAPSIIEGTSLTGTNVSTVNELLDKKVDKTTYDSAIQAINTNISNIPTQITSAINTAEVKVYDNDADLSALEDNTPLFFIVTDHASAN